MTSIIFMMMGIIIPVNIRFGERCMRVTRQAMDSGHGRIVEGAARLLRERGVRGTSVADAMNAAGMTHGGFYRHFRTKDDLVVESLRAAFDDFVTPLESRQHIESAKAVAAEYKAQYLSDEHAANPGYGCPMPALGSDLARESASLKAEFASGLKRVIAALAKSEDGSRSECETAATREIAMLVGAVVLARAVDAETAQHILGACRDCAPHEAATTVARHASSTA
jgi:TetR/AcrR family transcriptional repressor of nem operon